MTTPFVRSSHHHVSFISMLGLCLLVLTACGAEPQRAVPPELSEQGSVITQTDTGLAVIRVEQFQTNTPRGEHSWQLQKDTTSQTGITFAALPDINSAYATAPANKSPQLDYQVRFVKAGTHYVWVYGQAPAQVPLGGDSLHVGINGLAPASSSRIGDLKPSYSWINSKMLSGPATINVAKPGLHTLNVWMREDGARVSAIAVSNNLAFRPDQSTLATSPATPAPSNPVQNITPEKVAFSASALRDSVGINIHSGYTDTAYYNLDRVAAYLKDLGVPWVREGVYPNPKPNQVPFLRALDNTGMKITLGVGSPSGGYGTFGTGQSAALINTLKTTYAGLYDQLEMPNEWDLFSPTGNWLPELNAFYDEYYRAIRSDAYFANIRFIGPSFGRGGNSAKFGKSADAANLHPYAGGTMPENSDIAKAIQEAKGRSPTGDVVATELGYHNAVNTTSGHRGVPEDIVGHYMIRMLLWNYLQGIQQSYIYQLFDQKPNDPARQNLQEWFGLIAVEGNPDRKFQSSWVLRKKPAFHAVKRFLSYIEDPGSAGSPTTLPFEAVNLPVNTMMVPISRRDGSYDIAVWLTNNLWERESNRVLADSSAQATFRFASSVDVSSFRPSISDTVTQVGDNVTELDVEIDGKVTFLQIRP